MAGQPYDNADAFIMGTSSLKWSSADCVGMGFVLGPRHVLTCAHVVAQALGGELGKDAIDGQGCAGVRRVSRSTDRVAPD